MKRKSVEWYTPPELFDDLGIQFDLDPASPVDFETPVPAAKKLTMLDDGLAQPWQGRVWLNPPYGVQASQWMDRMIDHGHGIALVFCRTDARWCQRAMASADAMLFVAGRLQFIPGAENVHKRSRCGAASLLLAWGADCVSALQRLRGRGVFIDRTQAKETVLQ